MRNSELATRIVSRRDVLRGLGAVGLAAAASRVSLASSPAQAGVEAFKPVRFAVIGDWGIGEGGQMAIAGDRRVLDEALVALRRAAS
jgi:hypothetical protein